jgi:uncharacterized protein with HEPN domain
MTARDDTVSLRQMRDAAQEIIDLVRPVSKAKLETDRVLSLAVLQLLQITGEAARRVSASSQEAHPQIPWAQMIGLRNRLIHGYDTIDFDIVWNVIIKDLPSLVAALDGILGPR